MREKLGRMSSAVAKRVNGAGFRPLRFVAFRGASSPLLDQNLTKPAFVAGARRSAQRAGRLERQRRRSCLAAGGRAPGAASRGCSGAHRRAGRGRAGGDRRSRAGRRIRGGGCRPSARRERSRSAKGELEFRDGGGDAVVVVSHPREIGGPEWPAETATVMRFRDERVISLQDYRTEAEALDAVAQA